VGSDGKKERDLERTRQAILDASAEEFSEYGFSGARVDRISQKAGCNKAMIYYIFKNKDELHLAALENLFEEKIREVEAHLKNGNGGMESLFPMMAAYLNTFMKKQAYARMILYDIASGGQTLRTLKERRPDLFEELDVITGLIRNMGDAGLIRKIDPDKSVTVVLLMVVGLSSLMPHADLLAPKDTERFKALTDQGQWLSFLIDLVGRAIRPEKES
jgi:AcrR family transcriptional regulator